MTSAKYIGLDVHKESISIAVLNSAGKVVMECVIETKASTILQFIHGLGGDVHLTFEEGTWAGWLYDLLKPYVTELVVCNPRKNALLKEGSKSDRIDAHKLAELLYMSKLSSVYHGEHGLRMLKELSRSYLTITKDLGRVMNRQGIVSGLGHSLCRDASLRTALSFGMARQDSRSRRAPAGRTLLPTTRRPAAGAPTSPERTVGRGEEAPCDEVATADSWYWSASGGSLGGVDADASSVSHQAATVELQRAGVGDPRQRAVPRRGGTTTTFEETRHPARSQRQSQPLPQRYFQGCGDESQHRGWTAARFL